MTGDDFNLSLQKMGIDQAQFAQLVGVTPRAVNMWLAGSRSVPGPVVAYVDLIGSLPPAMRQAELAKVNEENVTMKDGMYLIEFAGQEGTGAGALVLDSGRIYGADVGGAKYDGDYQFNENTGLVDVTLRVEMPANIPSVIGPAQPFDWILEVSTILDPSKDSGDMSVKSSLGRPINAKYRFMRSLPMAA